MMTLLLPSDIIARIRRALVETGSDEIGGVLMGEDVHEGMFRVVDLTVQERGSFAHFVRQVRTAVRALRRFFKRTAHDYRRFNYLGEWHSHPSFPLQPSYEDRDTMLSIVNDPATGANFAVLMLTKLTRNRESVEAVAIVFQRGCAPFCADIVFEEKQTIG